MELLKLWRGLFYCMWMSDKPLVQEELARKLASLVQCFRSDEHGEKARRTRRRRKEEEEEEEDKKKKKKEKKK